MMILVLLIVFIDVDFLYPDFDKIINFVVGRCLVEQWREFWFNIYLRNDLLYDTCSIFFLDSIYKLLHGVLWHHILCMIVYLVVLIFADVDYVDCIDLDIFCGIFISWFMLCTNSVCVFTFCSIFFYFT